MILLFAGTSNARILAQKLIQRGEKLTICTATEYGASLYPNHENILEVHPGALGLESMETFVKARNPDRIIDATHPFAVRVSWNIRMVAKKLGILLDINKRAEASYPGVSYAKDFEDAYRLLQKTEGNILLTIGSNHLKTFATEDLLPRIYARMLPTVASMQKCEKLNFLPSRIIAMQGPFTVALNQAMFEQYDIKVMLSKDSGKEGGVEEKVMPALEAGIQVILIRRPEEEN